MGEQKGKNTFKENSQSEYFIINVIVCYLKFLCSAFTNLQVRRFIWCHISHANTIKIFSNYQGKTWYYSVD